MKIILIILLTISITYSQTRSEMLHKRGRRMCAWGAVLCLAYGLGIPLIIGGIVVKKRARTLEEKGE